MDWCCVPDKKVYIAGSDRWDNCFVSKNKRIVLSFKSAGCGTGRHFINRDAVGEKIDAKINN